MDWLIHGESFVPKKYVILTFVDGKDGDDGYSGDVAYEIGNSEHFKIFFKALEEIFSFCEGDDGESVYLANYYTIDRGQYRSRRDFVKHEVVDDATVEAFEEMAKERDPECMHQFK